MKNKKTVVRNVILVFALLLVVLVVVLSLNDLSQIAEVLKNIQIKYLLLALLFTALYWVTWGLSLFLIMIHYPSKLGTYGCFLVSSSDLFFNGITPFSTGGQPFQIYAMSRGKMKTSEATSAVMSKMIIYQVAIIIVSTIALFIGYQRVVNAASYFMILVFIGYIINLFVFLFLICVSTCNWAKKAALGLFNLVGKIKFLKTKMEKKRESFIVYCNDFQSSFIGLLKHPAKLVASLCMTTLNLILMFMIPYFLLKSVDFDVFVLEARDIPYVTSLVALNSAFMCWLPTPGAAGGAEYGFQTLLLTISGVTSPIAVSVMLLWRFFTYYLTMVYGLITYLLLEKHLTKIEREEKENSVEEVSVEI